MTDYLIRMFDTPTNAIDATELEEIIQQFIDDGYQIITINNSGLELIYHFVKVHQVALQPIDIVVEHFDIDDFEEDDIDEEDDLEEEWDDEELLARVRNRRKQRKYGPDSDDFGRD